MFLFHESSEITLTRKSTSLISMVEVRRIYLNLSFRIQSEKKIEKFTFSFVTIPVPRVTRDVHEYFEVTGTDREVIVNMM